MNLDLVIAQLKTYALLFGGRVAGAAEFAQSKDQEWMTLPACYVIPLEDSAAPNDTMNALRQIVTERIGVVIEIDNTADRRGQGAADQLETARVAVFSSILNWRVDPYRASRGLEYEGGRLLDFDRARLFWQWEFSLEVMITELDGWIERGTPLTEIVTTIPADGSGPPVVVDTVLPQ